jgi:diamine N-acetyltransferase
LLIIGKRLYIRILHRSDVEQLKNWGTHQDPLFETYNFPKTNKQYRDYWYQEKQGRFFRKIYGVFLTDGRLVGYITLKSIRRIRKIAELGVVFDPKELSKGYGKEALEIFLSYWLKEGKLKEIYLFVGAFNIRAKKVYQQLGFIKEYEYWESFENPKITPEILETLGYDEEFFKIYKGEVFCKYLRMRIRMENIHNIHKVY